MKLLKSKISKVQHVSNEERNSVITALELFMKKVKSAMEAVGDLANILRSSGNYLV